MVAAGTLGIFMRAFKFESGVTVMIELKPTPSGGSMAGAAVGSAVISGELSLVRLLMAVDTISGDPL